MTGMIAEGIQGAVAGSKDVHSTHVLYADSAGSCPGRLANHAQQACSATVMHAPNITT